MIASRGSPRSQSGRTSAPRPPQPPQIKRGSRSDSLTFVRPAVGVQRDVMAAMAIDQDAAHAHLAHLAEGDLDRPAIGMCGAVAAGSNSFADPELFREVEDLPKLLILLVSALGLEPRTP